MILSTCILRLVLQIVLCQASARNYRSNKLGGCFVRRPMLSWVSIVACLASLLFAVGLYYLVSQLAWTWDDCATFADLFDLFALILECLLP